MKPSQLYAGLSAVSTTIFERYGDFPLQAVALLMGIPEKGDTSLQECAKRLNLSTASLSRNASLLAGLGRKRQDAAEIKLAEIFEDPNDRRYKRIRLTDEGRAYRMELARAFTGAARVELEVKNDERIS